MKKILLPFLISLGVFSCGEKDNTSSENTADFRMEIVDSMRIDYLGSLWIQDYDSIAKQFVAVSRIDQELVVIDQKGKVNSSFVIPQEGPNSLVGIFSLSFRDGGFQIFDSRTGFHSVNIQGLIESKLALPYSYIYVNQSINPAFYSLGNEMVYVRPERQDSLGEGAMGGLIQFMYELPILEAYDSVSNEVRHLMEFPPTSLYADGNYYFIPFPTVRKYEDRWYLHFARELKYFVYKEDGLDLILDKTVDLGVSDAVLPVGVPFEQLSEYAMQNQQAGMIVQLYHHNGNTIVIYTKGIPEERVLLSQTDPSVELLEKTYAAVFDENNKLLKNDIFVPEGLIFSRAMTEKGEILAMKDQDYFGVEEEFVIYYKLKLIN